MHPYRPRRYRHAPAAPPTRGTHVARRIRRVATGALPFGHVDQQRLQVHHCVDSPTAVEQLLRALFTSGEPHSIKANCLRLRELAVGKLAQRIAMPEGQGLLDPPPCLYRRFEALAAADLLGGRTLQEAVMAYSCLWEDMAALELRATQYPPEPERMWRQAVQAILAGFASPPPARPEQRQRRSRQQ